MYLGQVVERAAVKELFANPLHPYTAALMKSIPKLDFDRHEKLSAIRGMVPHPFARPAGRPFSDRCDDYLGEECSAGNPPLEEVSPGHWVRCIKYRAASERVS